VLSKGRPRNAAVNFSTAAMRGFQRDSTAFELNNSINHGKITALHMSIYCL